MRRPFRTLCLLILSGVPAFGAEETWQHAVPGWHYEFPKDHGPHRNFKTEWWYTTGTLTDTKGSDFGFQLTFFRQGIRPDPLPATASHFRVTEIPFAHFAVTDIGGGSFRHFQKSARGAFGEAGFAIPSTNEPRLAWIDGWELSQDSPGHLHLKATEKGRSINLTLMEQRAPLIHGKDGISPKSAKPGHASHYYSLTRLHASGTVTINGVTHSVSGLVWFDHEWATNSLDPDEAGWDWSGLHLSDGADLMLFRIRDLTGATVFVSGTLRRADGHVETLSDLTISPIGTWKSPHTGGLYPEAMRVVVPSEGIDLLLKPRIADQELLLTPFAYWEGMVRGEGGRQGTPITAEGYLELTGYGGKIMGVNGKSLK